MSTETKAAQKANARCNNPNHYHVDGSPAAHEMGPSCMAESSARHTEGPWRVYDEPGVFTHHIVGPEPEGIRIADVDWQCRNNWKANARLISAAPEMLEALEGMFDSFCCIDKNSEATLCMECGERIGTCESCETCIVTLKAPGEESSSSTTPHARPLSRSTLPVRCLDLSKRKRVKKFPDGFWGFCLCIHFRLIDINGICCSCGYPMEIKA